MVAELTLKTASVLQVVMYALVDKRATPILVHVDVLLIQSLSTTVYQRVTTRVVEL
jgi:hypothetical protein